MNFDITENRITKIVKRIAFICEFKYCNYEISKYKDDNENYFSKIIPIKIFYEHFGKNRELHLILKVAPSCGGDRLRKLFRTEAFVYSKLLRKYKDIQHRITTSIDRYVIPKFYLASTDPCNEVLVLQDLAAKGFEPYTLGMFLDLDHVIVTMKSLAKLHAFSFILKERNRTFYDEVSKVCLVISRSKQYVENSLRRLSKAQAHFKGSPLEQLLEKLRRKNDEVYRVDELIKPTCICHSDTWHQNMIFQYKDSKPAAVCILDYQTTYMSSPALDVLFHITTSTDAALRNEHYKELLAIYYATFDRTLNEVGLKSHELYPRESLDRELKAVAPACYVMSNGAMWLLNGLEEEGYFTSKKVLVTEDEKRVARNRFKGIMADIIEFYLKQNYFDAVANEI